jgi:hypothetical protein
MTACYFVVKDDRIVLAEVRVIPDAGRFPRPAPRSELATLHAGGMEWTVGPPQIAKGSGEWTRRPGVLGDRQQGGVTARMLGPHHPRGWWPVEGEAKAAMREPKHHPGIREHHGKFQVRFYGPDGKRRSQSFAVSPTLWTSSAIRRPT